MMPNNQQTIRELFHKVITDQCTDEEAALFFQLIRELPEDHELVAELESHWDKLPAHELPGQSIGASIRHRLVSRMDAGTPPLSKIHLLKTTWFRYAAAVLLIVTGVAIFNYLSHNTTSNKNTPPAQTVVANDVLPGSDKAILTLSDGRRVELNAAASETIQDGRLAIKNENGQLVYSNQGMAAINTMSTPNGGQYQLTLADGTRVWLNAASSISYPTAFTGRVRQVTITGEAYFEVAKNKTMPFVVKVGDAEVQVLGTQFNVMAYDNEKVIETTLLEGAVKFAHGNEEQLLHPGQQVQLSSTAGVQLIDGIQVDKVIAWKNGLFQFENAGIETIMRQIERWYDVEVEFKDPPGKELFFLEMPRSSKLSEMLKVLALTSHLKFDIEGKKLIVHSPRSI